MANAVLVSLIQIDNDIDDPCLVIASGCIVDEEFQRIAAKHGPDVAV